MSSITSASSLVSSSSAFPALEVKTELLQKTPATTVKATPSHTKGSYASALYSCTRPRDPWRVDGFADALPRPIVPSRPVPQIIITPCEWISPEREEAKCFPLQSRTRFALRDLRHFLNKERKLRITNIYVPERVYDKNLKLFYSIPSKTAPGKIIATSRSQKPFKRLQRLKTINSKFLNEYKYVKLNSPVNYVNVSSQIRSIMLLTKLRTIINTFRINRLKMLVKIFPFIKDNYNSKLIKLIDSPFLSSFADKLKYLYNDKSNPDLTANGQITVQHELDDAQFTFLSNTIASGFSRLSSKFGNMITDWKDKAFQITMHAASALTSKSRFTWATSSLGIIHALGLFSKCNLTDLTSAFTNCVRNPEPCLNTQPGTSTLGEGQMPKTKTDTDDLGRWSRFATMVWQFLGMAMDMNDSTKPKPKDMRAWGSRFMSAVRGEARSTTGFIAFFENFITVIKEMIGAIMSWWEPELKMLADLEKNQVMTTAWVEEVTSLRKLICSGFDAWDQSICNRIEQCIIVAQEFLKLAIQAAKHFPIYMLQTINNNYQWLLDQRLAGAKKGFSSVTRYTPFCVYLFGDVGIGKSESATELQALLRDAMNLRVGKDPNTGVQSNSLVFTKPSTAQYFTNCSHQPIIYYDDFEQAQVKDTATADSATLIYLKSSAPFNPPMAAVSDKYLLYAPKVILASSNIGWPKPTYLNTPAALWRRRDVLVQLVWQEGWDITKLKNVEDKTAHDWAHCIFRVYTDPLTENGSYVDYDFKSFKKYLILAAKKYDKRETENLENRLSYIEKVVYEDCTSSCDLKVQEKLSTAQNILNENFAKNFNDCAKVKINKYYTSFINLFTKKPIPEATDTDVVDTVSKAMEDKNEKEVKSLVESIVGKTVDLQDANPTVVKKTALEIAKELGVLDEEPIDLTPEPILVQSAEESSKLLVTADVHNDPDEITTETNLVGEGQMPNSNDDKTDDKKTPPPEIDVANEVVAGKCDVLSKQPWYQDLCNVVCEHSVDNLFDTCPNPTTKKLEHYISGVGNSSPKHIQVPLYKCPNECIFNNSFVRTRFKRRYGLPKTTMMVNILATTSIPQESFILNARKTETIWHYIKSTMTKLLKNVWKVLKVVFFILGALLAIVTLLLTVVSVFFGISTAISAGARKLVDKDPTPLCQIVKQEALCNLDTARNYNVMERQLVVELIGEHNAVAQDQLNQAQGEGSPYTYADLSPKTSNSKPVVTRSQLVGISQNQSLTDVTSKISKSVVFLTVSGRDKMTNALCTTTSRGIGLVRNYICVPRHYLLEWSKLDPATITMTIDGNNFKNQRLTPSAIERIIIEKKELCLLNIPNITQFKNLTNLFATESDWAHQTNRQVHIIEVDQSLNSVVYNINSQIYEEMTLQHDNKAVAKIGPIIGYPWSASGRCMSVVLNSQCKIIGFHIAGNKTIGFAEPVVKETFAPLVNHHPSPDAATLEQIVSGSTQGPTLQIDTNVAVLGKVKNQYQFRQPTTSAIIKSDIHGVNPVYKVPAPLYPCKQNDFTDPLTLGVRKHGMQSYGFDRSIMQEAGKRLNTIFRLRMNPLCESVRVWDINDACNGLPNVPCLKGIEMNTSEGFPYISHRPSGVVGKHWLLKRTLRDNDKNLYEPTDYLLSQMNAKDKLRKQNIVPCTVFVDCLKDERLPLEKACTPGKVRIFSITPLDYIVQYRQYFSDFIAAYVSSRGTDYSTYHAIGIAPETYDWTALALQLQSKGPKVLCGDYSNFGPAFAVDAHIQANQCMLDWFELHGATKEDNAYRSIMLEELTYAIHLAKDCLYQVSCGMPSGSPETVIKNSLVNTLYIFYMWIFIWLPIDKKMASFDNMEKHLYFVTYGDDLIANVSDEASLHFNNKTLQDAFEIHGIKYTDESKSSQIRPFCSLSEATFLKRRFVPHPFRTHVIISQMPLEIATDVANWIHKCPDKSAASQDACYQSLSLLFGHGPEIYDKYRNKYIDAFSKLNIRTFTPRSWTDLDNIYFNNSQMFVSKTIFDDVYEPLNECSGICGNGQMADMMVSEEGVNVVTETFDTIRTTHDIPVVASDIRHARTTALLSTTDRITTLPHLTDRLILVDNINWTTSKATHDTLKTYKLPNDFIANSMDAPNFKILQSHAYYRPKYINLFFSLNSNKFSMGQLQISAYYDAHLDPNLAMRSSIYTRSQMLHTLLDAGSSNTVNLKIPYKHYNPWIRMSNKDDLGQYVQVDIKVVVPLLVASNTYKSCNIAVSWNMEGLELMGLRPSLDLQSESQMLPMAASLAMAYLNNRMSDKNRDKPPVQLNASPLEPRATGNLSLGTNTCEHLNALRLDARGQVPHPDFESDDCSVNELCYRYGMLDIIEWKTDDAAGKMLYSWDAAPLFPLNAYHKKNINNLDMYLIPPVGVFASCFDQFTGSVRFRFDIVGTIMHTGSFMIAFIPGYTASADPTYAKARFAYHVIYDVRDQRSFEFETPYVADKPWWPVLRLNAESKVEEVAYGRVFMYVVNPLIPMDEIPNTVKIVIYQAGSTNLQFAIPRQPQFSLPWNVATAVPPSDESVFARSGYYPWYVGTWRNLEGGERYIARYGAVSDHIAQFDGLRVGNKTDGSWFYYTCEDSSILWHPHPQSDTTVFYTGKDLALIPFNDDDGWGTIYLAITHKRMLKDLFSKKYSDSNTTPNWDKLLKALGTTNNTYSNGNVKLTLNKYAPIERASRDSSFEIIGQINDVRVGITPVAAPLSDDRTNIYSLTYGENFNNIKNLCRRYEYVTSLIINRNKQILNNVLLSLFGLPQGYNVDVNNLTSVHSRDGLQNLLFSGFRYFRGSMNFKFCLIDGKGSLWVQHRPDVVVNSLDVRTTTIDSNLTYYQHGYASVIGAISVNPILTVNVPFYNPNSFLLLQQPSLTASVAQRRAMSLGQIVVGLNAPPDEDSREKSQLHVYRSIGDDACPSLFVGFPPLVPTFIYRLT